MRANKSTVETIRNLMVRVEIVYQLNSVSKNEHPNTVVDNDADEHKEQIQFFCASWMEAAFLELDTENVCC